MSRKDIQIETNFYSDENTQLFKAELIEKSQLTAKSASSVAQRKSEPDASINSYRYEYVPDNEYSHSAVQEKTVVENSTNLPNVQKLQAAYLMESLLSAIAAGLFISCWETLKRLLSQNSQNYQSERNAFRQATYFDLKNEQVLKDFSNNLNQEYSVVESKKVVNQLSQVVQSVEQKKRQILQRQKNGITLDSLQKLRQVSKNKSTIKVIPQKDMTVTQNDKLSKQKVEFELQNASISTLQRQQKTSKISQKSYREKFEEYQHRNQSKEQRDILIGQNFNTETKDYGQQNKVGTWEYIIGHQNSSHNHANTSNQFSKNTRLHDTKYEYQAYYPYSNFIQQNQIFSYKSPLATNLNSARSNYQMEHNSKQIFIEDKKVINLEKFQQQEEIIAEHEWIRTRLLEEIIEKLNFSRLRLETRDHRSSQDLEMIRKIAKLQKLIMELKQDKQTQKTAQPSLEKSDKLQEQQILIRKFMEQFSSIRQQLSELKLYQESHQHQDESVRIINQQQILLNNYHFELQRLLKEKQEMTRVYHQSFHQNVYQPPVQIVHHIQELQSAPAKNFSQSRIGQKVVYRKVLFDGKHQGYEYEQRELREQEIRRMTERVRKMRGQQVTIVNSKMNITIQERSSRPIREKYQHELERLQKERALLRSQDDNCCVLLKY